MHSPTIESSDGDPVGFEAFLQSFLPARRNSFTSEAAVRVLAEYAGISELEASQLVDMRQSHHSMERMHMYAARLKEAAGRELSEERHRMTVMLPASESEGGVRIARSAWASDDCPSPSPLQPAVQQRRRICKQFREKGTCKFGSRCLYHHSSPVHLRQKEPCIARPAPALLLGIMDRCTEHLQAPKVSNESSDTKAKWAKREVLGALPSSTNNYCSPENSSKKSSRSGAAWPPPHPATKPDDVASPAPTAMGSIVMVPLLLPNGELYGYAPLPMHIQSLQAFHC